MTANDEDGVERRQIPVDIRREDVDLVAFDSTARLTIALCACVAVLFFVSALRGGGPRLVPLAIAAAIFSMVVGGVVVAYRRRIGDATSRCHRSGPLRFQGPIDDPYGIRCIGPFARRHRVGSSQPGVVLVLTSDRFLIIAISGKRELAAIPLAEVKKLTIELDHRRGRLVIVLADERRAEFDTPFFGRSLVGFQRCLNATPAEPPWR